MNDLIGNTINFLPTFAFFWYFIYQGARRRMPIPALAGGYTQFVLLFLAIPGIVLAPTLSASIVFKPGWLGSVGLGFIAIALVAISRLARHTPVSLRPAGYPKAGWSTPYIHGEIDVAAPVETVFAYIADPACWDSWSSCPRKTVRTSEGPWGIGATYRETLAQWWRAHSIRGVVVGFESPRLFALSVVVDESTAAECELTLTETSSQTVRVNFRARWRPLTPWRKITTLAFWPCNFLAYCSGMDRSLRMLRTAIEGSSSALSEVVNVQRIRNARIAWIATGLAVIAAVSVPWTLPFVLEHAYYSTHPFSDFAPPGIILLVAGPLLAISAMPGAVAFRYGRRARRYGHRPGILAVIVGTLSLASCSAVLVTGLFDTTEYEPDSYEPETEARCAGTFPGDCVSGLRRLS